MQKLHLVGFTPNFDGLIFSTRKGAKSGSYVVALEGGQLVKEIADAERLREAPARRDTRDGRLSSPRLVRPDSALSPREMQDRIRAGWGLDEVAAEAGVDLDWVSRFASPVLAEMQRVLDRARAATFEKPRVGPSGLPLGAAVRRNVLAKSISVDDDDPDEGWSAYQLDEEQWVVRFLYRSRGRAQTAEWTFDTDTGELLSRNRLGSQLAYTNRARVRRPPSAEPAVRPSTPRKATGRKLPAKKSAAKKSTAKKTAAKKTAAKKTAAKKTAAKKTAAKKTVPRKGTAPARARSAKATTRKTVTTRKPAARATSARKAAPRKAVATRATKARPPARSAAKKRSELPAAPPAPIVTAPLVVAAPVPRPAPAVSSFTPVPRPAPFSPPPSPPRRSLDDTGPVPVIVPVAPRVEAGPVPPAAADASPDGSDGSDGVEPTGAFQLDDPPLPGAVFVDPDTGIARIDSRRTSTYVSGSLPPPPPAAPPRRGPTFRGDVAVAGEGSQPARPGEADGEPPVPARRREPLRAP